MCRGRISINYVNYTTSANLDDSIASLKLTIGIEIATLRVVAEYECALWMRIYRRVGTYCTNYYAIADNTASSGRRTDVCFAKDMCFCLFYAWHTSQEAEMKRSFAWLKHDRRLWCIEHYNATQRTVLHTVNDHTEACHGYGSSLHWRKPDTVVAVMTPGRSRTHSWAGKITSLSSSSGPG